MKLLEWLATAWVVLVWVAMILVAAVLALLFLPLLRAPLIPARRRGIAPPASNTLFGYPIVEVEETRLMPGYHHDVVPEGLGGGIRRRVHSPTTPLEGLTKSERALWRTALLGGE